MSSPLLKKHGSKLPLLLCFAIPFVVSCVMFICYGLYPFGDGMILAHDGWHQYYPFFEDFHEKLTSGGSLQYTWSVGMGTGYASLFAYYLASPLNLLSVLVPTAWLREFFALLTILKISLAGLFFGLFLRIVYRKNDISLAYFALMYAFCSWVGGYYWNSMWLDTFALLPLLVTGTVCLLREGKFRLYVCALALSLWCNYYVAYFCCIFILLSFIIFCLTCWQGWKNFLRRFLRIGICTVIGVGIAAVLLIPTMKGMETTYSMTPKDFNLLSLNIAEGASGGIAEGQSVFSVLLKETIPGVISASREILANTLPMPEITKMSGLPNIYCGFCAAILAVYYFCCRKIKLREKILNLLLLLFLLLSFIFRALDYTWHGFHFTNMLPYRFSFLFSFVLIGMAFRAYTLMDDFKPRYLFAIVPVAGLLLCNAYLQEDVKTLSLILGGIVLLGMVVFFLLHRKSRWVSQALLFSIIFCELVLCFRQGVDKVSVTTRSVYPKDSEAVQSLLDKAKELSEDELFWRTETTVTQTLNDGAINGYNGVTIFTSSANVNFTRFSRSLGLSSWPGSNRTAYYESSPFTNTMCGIKYLLDRDGQYRNTSYNALIASEGGTNLLENTAFISLGFMTESGLADFVAEEDKYNPIWEQNDMFAKATGIAASLYTPLTYDQLIASDDNAEFYASGTSGTQYSYDCTAASDRSSLSVIYKATESGLYCATTKFSGVNTVSVYRNGEYLFDRNIKARALFSLGNYDAGDEIKLVYFIDEGKSGTFSLDVELMDSLVFNTGLSRLADEAWELTEVKDTYLCGTVTALDDGLFYTSVPYEPGWTALVDGKPVELAATFDPQSASVKLTDAMISFPLSAGTHTIELSYRMPGLTAGAVISAVCLLAFGALIFLTRKKYVLLPDPEKAPAEECGDTEPPALTEEASAPDAPEPDDSIEE